MAISENADKEVPRETRDIRQGTGPRSMVTVLLVSLLLAGAAAALSIAWFIVNAPPGQ